MIFLVDYHRPTGKLVQLLRFGDLEQRKAEETRLEIELKLNREGLGEDREVVLLQAEDEDALRRTHRRYFEDLRQMSTTSAHQSIS